MSQGENFDTPLDEVAEYTSELYEFSTFDELGKAINNLLPSTSGRVVEWTFLAPSYDAGKGYIGYRVPLPNNKLERLADETLDAVAEFFGKCVNDDRFCGFSTQPSLDAQGKPATLTITACEMLGEEPFRRVAV